MNSNNFSKPIPELITKNEFESLSYGTLVRYKCHFDLEVASDKITDRSSLQEAVVKHFNEMQVNPKEVIDQFLQLEKDMNSQAFNNTRKSMRNQEKAEKYNITRVLESFKKGN